MKEGGKMRAKKGLAMNAALLYLSVFAALISLQWGSYATNLAITQKSSNYYQAAALANLAQKHCTKKTGEVTSNLGTAKLSEKYIVVNLKKSKRQFRFLRTVV